MKTKGKTMKYGIFGDTEAMVKRAVLFENGDEEYPQDFIIVVTKNKTFEGGDYYIVTCIDDERPQFVECVGSLSPSDLDQLMRELVTGLLYSDDDDEYWNTYNSIFFENVPAFE